MNCGEAQLELALWVGQDLTDATRIEALRRHVAICPSCGQRAKSLQASLVALGSLEVQRTYDTSDSLWPELDARIRAKEAAPPARPSIAIWAVGLATATALCGAVWAFLPRSSPEPVAPVNRVESTPAEPLPAAYPYHQSPGGRDAEDPPGSQSD